MAGIKKDVNAGVHAGTGFEFQKHCALYLLLEKYEDIKDKKYFICIEHHDDFIFCHKSDNEISAIETYQAKKSSGKWGMSQEFIELLSKILKTGMELDSDMKPISYDQNLYFSTNNTINLTVREKSPTTKKSKKHSITVNEANNKIRFMEIEEPIRKKILSSLVEYDKDAPYLNKVDNLSLLYIDFAKTRKSQKDQLIGKFSGLFGKKVADHSAAVDSLLELFRDVELFFNQGNIVKLLDHNKQVSSDEINSVIDVITTKQKAYELWRSQKSNISTVLGVPISEQSKFESNFDNSFDLFKDRGQLEHQKILQFVRNNRDILSHHFDDVACINSFFNKFREAKTSLLDDAQVKAAIYAAYLETKGLE